MPTENQDFQKKGACVQISKGRTERVVFTREGLLLRNGNEIHTYNKEFGGNSDGNEAPDGWVKMGDGLMLVLKDINTQDMRLVFLDNEPLERNINRLADRVRLNAIVNVAKQEVKESARLTAVIFKAIDISDVSSGKCFGYLIDFKDTESPAAFKNVLIGKNSAVKALSSKSGFRGGVGGSDNNKSDTEKDKTIGGFGGFGEKTSPKKDTKETSIFGGGSSTSNIESKKDTSLPMFGSDALPTEERPASVRFGSDDKSKTELETKTKMVDYKEEITKIIKQYNPAKLGNIDILLNGKYKGKGHELLEKMQKKYLATANTSSGGFGSSNAPKPVDMGGFGSGGGFGNSDGSDAKSNGLSFGSSAGFGSSNAPKPVDMGGFGSGGFGKSSGGGSGFGAVSSNNNGGGGGFGGFGGGGQNNTNNTSASFSSPSFTQMRG